MSVNDTCGATDTLRTISGVIPVMPLTPPKYSLPSGAAYAVPSEKPSDRPSAVVKRATLPLSGFMRSRPLDVLIHNWPALSLRIARILVAPTLSLPP